MRGINARQTYNSSLRRQQIADAAIELLGSDGTHGLSHPRVDRRMGLPVGTASYYFRTRQALLEAAADRMNDLDLQDLSMMGEIDGESDAGYAGTRGLARLVMLSGTEPWLTRSRARYELTLVARGNEALAERMLGYGIRFYGLARDIVAQWHPTGSPPDEALIDEQATVVLTYVNGVMMSFVHGYPVVTDEDHLDRLIQGVLHGVAASRGGHRGSTR
jgi:AcrR family transcriptional regulator